MNTQSQLHLVTEPGAPIAPLPETVPAWTTGHDVQFYDTEDFLFATVADFLADGAKAGQPMVVICTEPHRQGFVAALRERHIELDDATACEIRWLDARETLAAFMERGSPNKQLFEATVGNVFEKLMASRSYVVVRAYGEMVDLLWKDGNVEGAIAVEELWNELAVRYPFNLLCAYSMGNFYKEAHSHSFRAICDHHTRVTPTETYIQKNEGDRLRQITLLEQRARALEAEVKHRRELESALRDTLKHRRRIEDELRRRDTKLREPVEAGLEAVHWVGSDGIVLWANAAECDRLGYAADEMIGRHIASFHADSGVIADILTRLTRGDELRNYPARLVAKDGSIRQVLISSSVFRQDGRFVHTRCFTRDVTGLQKDLAPGLVS